MSRTQVDFRGSSIQASSVSSGRVVSEVPISSLSTSATYVYADLVPTGTGEIALSTLGTGAFLVSGVTTTNEGAFSTVVHVGGKGPASYTVATGVASSSSGGASGTFTPSLNGQALRLTRSATSGADTVTVSFRKL